MELRTTKSSLITLEVTPIVDTRHPPLESNDRTAPQPAELGKSCDLDPQTIPSPVLARLIEEVRNEEMPVTQGYDRYDRFHNRHNR